MPKVAQDLALQERLNTFLRERNIAVSQAAKEFGVDRVSLWRFSTTGMARADKRAEYSAALDRATAKITATDGFVAVKENKIRSYASVEDRELRRIRQACECVLKLLDAYEGRSVAPWTSGANGR